MRSILFILLLIISLFSSAQESFELCAGESKVITFFSQSNGIGVCTWTINGQSYSGEDFTYVFTDPGIYNITVRRDNSICYAEETTQIRITNCPGIIYWVPNAFTPDGNEFNQQFGPIMTEGFDINDFTFLIINRWGEIVWESHDHSKKWDGTYGGKKCQDGVYSWKLRFSVFGNDGRIIDHGNVNLIR
jgi:gliding motility-associated-like protein